MPSELKIITIPNPLLSRKVQEISDITEDLKTLVENMRLKMIEAKGVGLAANQVNHDLQLFVIEKELAEEHGIPDVFLNPEITEYSNDTDEMEEGCLSIPKFFVPIKRSKKIKFKAMDLEGNKLKLKARGFLARVLQHETDHVHGIVIQDRFGK